MDTKTTIVKAATNCLATKGYSGASMRDIAKDSHVQTSVIYYYFSDKNSLFEAVYEHILAALQADIAPIRAIDDSSKRLRAILAYQLKKRKMLAALLNYFVGQTDKFSKYSDGGYVPAGAYYHILETLQLGSKSGVYQSHTSLFDAKIIAHIMNGFVLEYASRPLPKAESDRLVQAIADFIEAATTNPVENAA